MSYQINDVPVAIKERYPEVFAPKPVYVPEPKPAPVTTAITPAITEEMAESIGAYEMGLRDSGDMAIRRRLGKGFYVPVTREHYERATKFEETGMGIVGSIVKGIGTVGQALAPFAPIISGVIGTVAGGVAGYAVGKRKAPAAQVQIDPMTGQPIVRRRRRRRRKKKVKRRYVRRRKKPAALIDRETMQTLMMLKLLKD